MYTFPLQSAPSLARRAVPWGRILARLWCPEYVYPALVLLWGTVIALLLPPVQCADEDSHSIRSFHLSRGRLHPDGTLDGWLSGRAPASLPALIEVMRPAAAPQSHQRCLTEEEYRRFSSTRLEDEPECTAPFGYLSYTCFVPYVPQALGIALARRLGGSVLAGFYAGRLANLLFAVLALHLALRLMPFYKNLLGAVALLPVSVQQVASLSADATGFACCYLFTALALRLLAPAPRRAALLHLLGLCTLALLMPLCKIPYGVLTLLYLAVPASRLGSLRRYLLVGTALAAMTVLGIYITLRSSEGATHLREAMHHPEASCSRQAHLLRHHPEEFAKALGRSVAHWGWMYCEQLAIVGWLNVVVCFLPAKAYLLFLALLGAVDRRPDWCPSLRLLLMALGICGLGYVLFQLMLYLVWTPVGSPVIDGFQGRYFVGFLPTLLLVLYNRAVSIQANGRALFALTVAAAVGVQLATAHAVFNAYYLPAEPPGAEPFIQTVLLTGGLLFLATLFVHEWRAEKLEARGGPAEDSDPASQVEVRELSRVG